MDFVAREGVAPSGDTSSLHSRTAGEPSHVDRLHPRRHLLHDRASRGNRSGHQPGRAWASRPSHAVRSEWHLNGLQPGAFPEASSGTDKLGLDIFSRVLAALPLDLAIGVGIAGFAL